MQGLPFTENSRVQTGYLYIGGEKGNSYESCFSQIEYWHKIIWTKTISQLPLINGFNSNNSFSWSQITLMFSLEFELIQDEVVLAVIQEMALEQNFMCNLQGLQ